MNFDFIKTFQEAPCLWDKNNKYYGDPFHIKKAYSYLIKEVQEKWDYALTETELLQKIAVIQFLSEPSSKPTPDSNTLNEPWYCKELEFLKEKLDMPKLQMKVPKKTYTCEFCNEIFGSERNFRNHQFQMYGIAIYKCDKCNKSYKTADSLKRHFLTHLKVKFSCEFCNEIFRSEKKFRIHQFKRYGVAHYKCSVCEKGFINADTLKRHSFTHLRVEDRPFECNVCGAKFADKLNCAVHVRRHTKKYIHECKDCGKTFATTTELKMHMRCHSSERPFVCDECGESFKLLKVFKNHQNSRHFKKKPYKCKLCPKAFCQSTSMRDHMKTHFNIRNNICDICGKGFKLRKTLRQHKDIHSEIKKYICKICGKEFSQGAGLHGHLKTHQLCAD